MTKLALALAALFFGIVSIPVVRGGSTDREIVTQSTPAPTEDDWKFSVTPYVWLPGVNLDVSVPPFTIAGREFGGDLNTNSSWLDTLSNLGSGKTLILSADGRFEFSKGHWGGFADGYWIYERVKNSANASKLILDDHVQVAGASSVTNRLTTGQFDFGPRYLFTPLPLSSTAGGPTVGLEFYGGGRVNWIKNHLDGTVNLSAEDGGLEPAGTFKFDTTDSRAYIEPMLGLKTTWTLGENFVAIVRGDVGGFGVVAADNWDTDLEAGIGWQFHRDMLLDLGYRARGQWQDDGASDKITVQGWFHGPELGMTFTF